MERTKIYLLGGLSQKPQTRIYFPITIKSVQSDFSFPTLENDFAADPSDQDDVSRSVFVLYDNHVSETFAAAKKRLTD